jgi:hypothetical protein
MSRKCTHCGSYNTDRIVINSIGKGVVEIGRTVIGVAATLGSELLSRGTGKITGRKVEEATRVNIKCFHCNDCGNDFE